MLGTVLCALNILKKKNHSSSLLSLVILPPSLKLRKLSLKEVKLLAQVIQVIDEFNLRSGCPQSLCLGFALPFLRIGIQLSPKSPLTYAWAMVMVQALGLVSLSTMVFYNILERPHGQWALLLQPGCTQGPLWPSSAFLWTKSIRE